MMEKHSRTSQTKKLGRDKEYLLPTKQIKKCSRFGYI